MKSATFTGTLDSKSEDGGFLTLDLAGEGTLSVAVNTAVSSVDETKPRAFVLAQNYPNPFNAETIIEFQIPTEDAVRLDVYNLQGQRVSRLLNHYLDAGTPTALLGMDWMRWGHRWAAGCIFTGYLRVIRILRNGYFC